MRLIRILIIIFFLGLFNFSIVGTSHAAPPTIQVEFPCLNVPGLGGCPSTEEASADITQYIISFYQFAVGIIGIIAVGVIVYGAIQYTLSAGNPDRQRDATSRITSALWGLALLLGSFLILQTINPQLIELKQIVLTKNVEVGEFFLTAPAECFNQTALESCESTAGNILAYGIPEDETKVITTCMVRPLPDNFFRCPDPEAEILLVNIVCADKQIFRCNPKGEGWKAIYLPGDEPDSVQRLNCQKEDVSLTEDWQWCPFSDDPISQVCAASCFQSYQRFYKTNENGNIIDTSCWLNTVTPAIEVPPWQECSG